MPVKLVTPVQEAAPIFDEIHLENLVISLEQTAYGKAAVKARLRLYRREVDGSKTFDTKFTDITIADAEAWATESALAGDMRGANAVNNIKALVALLVETNTAYGATVVS